MYCDICPHKAEIDAALYPCQLCEHAHLEGLHEADTGACKACPNLKAVQGAMRPCEVCEAGKLHGQVSADAASMQWTQIHRAEPVRNYDEVPDMMDIADGVPIANGGGDGDGDGDGNGADGDGAGTVHIAPPADGGADAVDGMTEIERIADEGKRVTNLPHDVEDAMRMAFAVIFDFTPMELLLIQHVMHGRNVSTFREPLAQLRDRLNTRYDLSAESKTFKAIAHEWKKKVVEKLPPIAGLFNAVTDANKAGHNR